jgi:protein-tyrosine phosphatase
MWISNLRDLGGLPTDDERTIRPGLLFRSEAPDTLSEDDRRRIADLALVFDLRAAGEAEALASRPANEGTAEIVEVPLMAGQRVYGTEVLVGLGTDPAYSLQYMTDLYADLLAKLLEGGLREFAERVGGKRQVPVLVHCTGGQDRTGVMIAVILLALGVPRDVVVADYIRSIDSWSLARITDWMHGALGPETTLVDEALEQMLAHPHHIERAIDHLLATHGSIEGYWSTAGVDAADLERLRSVLLS